MRVVLGSLLLALAACAAPATAPGPVAKGATTLCASWSEPERAGAIDPVALKEASGLAVSRAIADRLYHHNDSGMGPKFFVTDMKGGNLRMVTIPDYEPRDIEDMSLGACGDGRTCLVFGDIGDNAVARPSVEFVFVPEKATFAPSERPLRRVKARYPDKAHNAEGFAIHPDGDLYLVSKVRANVVQVFKLTRQQLAVTDGTMQVFAEVGRIDVGALMGVANPQVTSFDISPDGKRALILTYGGAVEIAVDLSKPLPPQSEWQLDHDYKRITLARLLQLEAIAYTPDGKGFVYDSELPVGFESILYRQRCTAP